MFCCRHILPIVCDCVVGIGFGGLWRFAGPFTKVSTTVPVSIFLVYATPLLWEMNALVSYILRLFSR